MALTAVRAVPHSFPIASSAERARVRAVWHRPAPSGSTFSGRETGQAQVALSADVGHDGHLMGMSEGLDCSGTRATPGIFGDLDRAHRV